MSSRKGRYINFCIIIIVLLIIQFSWNLCIIQFNSNLSPGLNIVLTWAIFQMFGKVPVSKLWFIIQVKDSTISLTQIFRSLMRTLLTPVPLLADVDFIHFLTKLFVIGGRENSSPVSFFCITNYSNFWKVGFPWRLWWMYLWKMFTEA